MWGDFFEKKFPHTPSKSFKLWHLRDMFRKTKRAPSFEGALLFVF